MCLEQSSGSLVIWSGSGVSHPWRATPYPDSTPGCLLTALSTSALLVCVAGFEPAFPHSRCPSRLDEPQNQLRCGFEPHFRRSGVLPLDETHMVLKVELNPRTPRLCRAAVHPRVLQHNFVAPFTHPLRRVVHSFSGGSRQGLTPDGFSCIPNYPLAYHSDTLVEFLGGEGRTLTCIHCLQIAAAELSRTSPKHISAYRTRQTQSYPNRTVLRCTGGNTRRPNEWETNGSFSNLSAVCTNMFSGGSVSIDTKYWWLGRVSNPRRVPFQDTALPTELPSQV